MPMKAAMIASTIPPMPTDPTPMPMPRRSSTLPLLLWSPSFMALSPLHKDLGAAFKVAFADSYMQRRKKACRPSARLALAQSMVVIVARGIHARDAKLHGPVAEGERDPSDLEQRRSGVHAEQLRHVGARRRRAQALVGAQHV